LAAEAAKKNVLSFVKIDLSMRKYLFLGLPVLAMVILPGFNTNHPFQLPIGGAWHRQVGTIKQVIILQDGYFTFTEYDQVNKKFVGSFGGTISIAGQEMHAGIEFDTKIKEQVGQHKHFAFQLIDKNNLKTNIGGTEQQWKRLDEGSGGLAGNWRISARMNNGQMQPMQRSARKTLKILSATRFQWMAINPETKEFFGTGGGTYTFQNGKYTENIEFFSRDSSRVGASLSFDGSVSGNTWTHKGLSSRGEPIHEEWSREK
jgi:hypothetical protein